MSDVKRTFQFTQSVLGLMLALLLLVGCGGEPAEPALSDAEFTQAAQAVCSTLKTEISAAATFENQGQGYRRAADQLSEMVITEQSAPQGFQLRSGLITLANSYDAFNQALAEAITRVDIEESYSIMITEDGSVYASPDNVSNLFEKMANMQQLTIEPDLVLKLIESEAAFQETAIALGLKDCAMQE